jgi:ribosomal protein L12E/L44/L45/RPP1/RPP2
VVAIAPEQSILSVSMPPYARLRLDVNARDEDVLGVVKSFLRGFKGKNLQDMIASMSRPGAADIQAPATNDITKSSAVKTLSEADLETVLGSINHARFVVFETANPTRAAAALTKHHVPTPPNTRSRLSPTTKIVT